MYVVSCFVYVCCIISVSSYYFCICMYVQGSTENQFTEWTPCRNTTITITIMQLTSYNQSCYSVQAVIMALIQ